MLRFAATALVLIALASFAAADDDWPQFRGPDGQGNAGSPGLPLTWSETENIAWKTAIPGKGWSSPVILGGQIWLTTATGEGRSLRAVCIARDSGSVVHDVEVFQIADPPPVNGKNSHASPTPVVEPGFVWVHYGTFGTACLSSETGQIVWASRELKLDHKEGPGSSPIVHGGLLIVNCDGIDVQYVAALDKATGELKWKTARSGTLNPNPDFRKAYSTPLVVEAAGREQLISTGAEQVIAYDPSSGEELWKVAYPGFSNVPRPVAAEGLIYVCTGYMQPELWAIRPDGQGDVTETHVAWRAEKQAPANPSPVLAGELLFMLSDDGILTCLEAASGSTVWKHRLEGNYSASLLHADGRLYAPSEEGLVTVVEAGRTYQPLAANQLDGRLMASAAVAGRALYLRTETHLYRVEADAAGTPRTSSLAPRP